jgi:vacuole morphology and inheritance protein 14
VHRRKSDDLPRKYLSDPTEDVRVATEILLADFLREIRDVSTVRKKTEEQSKLKHTGQDGDSLHQSDGHADSLDHATFLRENEGSPSENHESKEDYGSDFDLRDTGGIFF